MDPTKTIKTDAQRTCDIHETEDGLSKFDIQLEDNQQQQVNFDSDVFDRIASKLLRSGLYLTALELHAELIERGQELPRLREYFDNPKNFEKSFSCSPKLTTDNLNNERNALPLPHSPSEVTFDSSDFTHYSDEDALERHGGDEKIAVLEFELRKAQQTIQNLRACLTISATGQLELGGDQIDDESKSTFLSEQASQQPIFDQLDSGTVKLSQGTILEDSFAAREFYYRGSADGDSCPGDDDKQSSAQPPPSLSSFPSTSTDHFGSHQPSSTSSLHSLPPSIASNIRPLERRALNYLINEYLMQNCYKLTSITFSDELASCEDQQDCDKWEDVGLNIETPPNLLRLYRHYWQCTGGSGGNRVRTNSGANVHFQRQDSRDLANSNLTMRGPKGSSSSEGERNLDSLDTIKSSH